MSSVGNVNGQDRPAAGVFNNDVAITNSETNSEFYTYFDGTYMVSRVRILNIFFKDKTPPTADQIASLGGTQVYIGINLCGVVQDTTGHQAG